MGVLLACFAASQTFAGLKIKEHYPIPTSGVGGDITTTFIGDDKVMITMAPANRAEIAHYGAGIRFNTTEYEFVETESASVFMEENGLVIIASSYVFSPNRSTEDMSVVFRRISPDWGRLEPEGLDVFTRSRERKIYDPAPAFTPNPDTATALPLELALFQNYPNPFNPSTEIRFSLAGEGSVELAVYNTVGQKVRTLVSEPLAAGEHTVQWDATDDAGDRVTNGIYLYRIKSPNGELVRKMLLLK
ncbi:MAG: T9SS type A sorting domain-containing protein [Candidatus Sungbacteria bacterium]|uniref:T9SS type A sorting domain-containing protein n=1 Tax=Candidatus Sungiibacteriota bacterium TaxID=2750080 RepID=A0A931YDS3_9BACT|nr:T9SS type A sorting domain-containing protein [Candidatus Sungbacteria bacterium]MBI2466063.1 T9SS type A sorting domain-containing protein [Candidatus Sungbacteria bacterium]